ncbi:MAG: preprotein translocase subunit YajC [Bacteroidaceae bacterium]|nr:preprotein translocase subunit YajC [Bacteroidaceae bacterium]MBQ5731515.1 preprotein translocase subunit YajC [Bacteroidaceae bacterium]
MDFQSILSSPITMMIVIFAIFYFLMIRPQQKRQKQIENFRNGLQTGQEVVTSGGIYGKVKSIDGNIVNVEVANGVVMRFDRSAIYASSAMTQAQ